jgi:hypothetical protein
MQMQNARACPGAGILSDGLADQMSRCLSVRM